MTYTIEAVDLNDVNTELEIRRLVQTAFHDKEMVAEKHVVKKMDSKASKPSLFLAAKENGKIIGCNGFVAFDCLLNGKLYVAYQSCWTATHPEHQGKKIFSNLINEAKRILQMDGAAFIYGIANEKSNPIITKKLLFTEIPSVFVRIPNIPFLRNSYFTKASVQTENAVVLNESQLYENKNAQFPDDIKLIRHHKSWAWGKLMKKRRFGINVSVFYIGGIQLAESKDLPQLIKNIFLTQKPFIIQITSCSNNTVNSLIKKWKPSGYLNGFIHFNLNIPHFDHFNLMIGAIDVF